jgi:transposase
MLEGNRPAKEVLVDLYANKFMTLQQIGDKYGVSRQRVLQWLNYYEIERVHNRNFDRALKNTKLKKSELTKLVKEGLSTKQISKQVGERKDIIEALLAKYDLTETYNQIHSVHFKYKRMPSKAKLEKLYNSKKPVHQILKELGCAQNTFYKWLDYYGIERQNKPKKTVTEMPSKTAFEKDYNSMTLGELAEKYDCGTATIYHWISVYQLPKK